MLKNYGRYSLRDVFLIALGLLIAVQEWGWKQQREKSELWISCKFKWGTRHVYHTHIKENNRIKKYKQ